MFDQSIKFLVFHSTTSAFLVLMAPAVYGTGNCQSDVHMQQAVYRSLVASDRTGTQQKDTGPGALLQCSRWLPCDAFVAAGSDGALSGVWRCESNLFKVAFVMRAA